jgi:putative endonuclease
LEHRTGGLNSTVTLGERPGSRADGAAVSENFYVYMLANKRNGTLYIGVTNDLVRRVFEHKQDAVPGFTKRYGVHTLVYFEQFDDPVAAIQREKAMKFWRRRCKIEKIEETNPTWRDLYEDIAAP